jgi:multicomponent Na+:H+ antiporter subunit G
VIGEAAILLGCVLSLLAGVGVLRFGDVFERMHALTKASASGLILVLIGAAFLLPSINDVTTLALAAFLQVLTLPVAANLIAGATYRAEGVPHRIDTVDELRDTTEGEPDPGDYGRR